MISSILQEISQKDKTYMNLLGSVSDTIKQIAQSQKDKQIKE